MNAVENDLKRQELSEIARLRERLARAEVRSLCDTTQADVKTIQAVLERHGDHLESSDARLLHAEETIVKLEAVVATLQEQAKKNRAPVRRQRLGARKKREEPQHLSNPPQKVAGAPVVTSEIMPAKRARAAAWSPGFPNGRVDLATARNSRSVPNASAGKTIVMTGRAGVALHSRAASTAGGAALGAFFAAALGDPKNRARNALLGAALGAFLSELAN